jgi:GTP-binding protein
MDTTTIAIIGRPNVGKSSLFNILLGYRRTIVSAEAGTTLDLIEEKVLWEGKVINLFDSQGIYEEADEKVLDPLLQRADALVFVVDSHSGVTPYDLWMSPLIQRSGKPCLLVVNKDDANDPGIVTEFSELGFETVVAVSAAHKKNIDLVREWCAAQAISPETQTESLTQPDLTLTILGRPNTGKSTLMNRFCKESVSRVSPVALTTRDTVSYELQTKEGVVRFLDTAGMRRPRSKKGEIETFSIHAATRAIRQSDVVLLAIAANAEVADQDARLLSLLVRENKPTIVLFNFWDQLGKKQQKDFFENTEFLDFLKSFPTLSISGKTGYQVDKILPLAFRLARQGKKRVSTSKLNRIVERIIEKNPPPYTGTQNFNILYASQVAVEPPTFVFFMNRKAALPPSYTKYLENSLKKSLRFKGQPIRLYFRGGESRYSTTE